MGDGNASVSGRRDVGFRVGRCGRFEWEANGEAQYVQFLPPVLKGQETVAEGFQTIARSSLGILG